MSMEMRPYIARGGEKAWRGLSAFKNATLCGFAVKANPRLVHQMLTRYIGEPSQELGLHVDVRGTSLNYVLFLFLDSERRQVSRHKDFRGGHPEKMFAVVALGYRKQPNESWISFAPYVFASDTPGWTADREIYGYPRQLGDVSIVGVKAGLPTQCAVSARVIKRFGEAANSCSSNILRIRKTSNAQGEQIDRNKLAEGVVAALGAVDVTLIDRSIPRVVAKVQRGATAADRRFFERRSTGTKQWKPAESATPLRSLTEQLKSHSLPMLFLKQFRDVTYADRACYQAILEAVFQLGDEIEGSVAHDYELYLEDIDSVPIGREFGIPTNEPVTIDFGFRIRLDEMSLSTAEVISNPYWNPAVEFSSTEEPPRLPMYVDRGGEAVWRQPSMLYDARIFGFGLPVPAEQQQTLLDEFVNEVVAKSNSTYGSKKLVLRPCDGVGLIMLLFVDYKRITSGDPNDRKLGGTTYREFLLMQLAISDDAEFPELDWFIPYICLDADAPRLGGREIFGYPKQLARITEFDTFEVPNGAIAPARKLSVQTTVFSKLNSTKAGSNVPIVSVTAENGLPTITPFHGAEDMFLELFKSTLSHADRDPAVRRLFPAATMAPGSGASSGPGVEILNALFFTGIGNVFLKEFRDSLNPGDACYQAVCKTDTIPATFHGGGCIDRPEDYSITIANVASEPVRTILKESGLYRNVVRPKFAYVLNLDLELTAGRVIANPMALDASLDVSSKSTAVKVKDRQPAPRVRRVSTSAEPYWRRVVEDAQGK